MLCSELKHQKHKTKVNNFAFFYMFTHINPNHSNTFLPKFFPFYMSMYTAPVLASRLPLVFCISNFASVLINIHKHWYKASLSDAKGSFAGCLWLCCCRGCSFISWIIIDNAFLIVFFVIFINCCCRIFFFITFFLHFLQKENTVI